MARLRRRPQWAGARRAERCVVTPHERGATPPRTITAPSRRVGPPKPPGRVARRSFGITKLLSSRLARWLWGRQRSRAIGVSRPWSSVGELRERRRVDARGQLLERPRAHLGIEDLDAPRALVTRREHRAHEPSHVELAFTAHQAMVDRVLVQVPGRLEGAVVDLDAAQELRRYARHVRKRDAELHDVPQIEDDASVRGVRQCMDVREGDEFETDAGAVATRLLAQGREGLDELRHGAGGVEEIADLDVAGT